MRLSDERCSGAARSDRSSSIFMTVGTQATKVIFRFAIQSKKREPEKRATILSVNPFWSHGIRLVDCGDVQLNERYSSVLSAGPKAIARVASSPHSHIET